MNDRASIWLDASLRYRLWFAEVDEHDTASLPFALCRRGDRVVARHLSCGWIGEREVRAFDLDVLVRRDERSSPNLLEFVSSAVGRNVDEMQDPGFVLRERWACALVRAGAACWRLSVAAEGLLSTLADLAIVPDQDLEFEAFNRAFEVRADNRAFASAFLDARMAAFLVDRGQSCVVETVGDRILVARPAVDASDADSVIGLAIGVAERMPSAVRLLHPPLPSGELTPGCPIGPDGTVRRGALAPPRHEPFDPWPDVPKGWA